MKRIFFTILFSSRLIALFGQNDTTSTKTPNEKDIEFERPFNFFAAAGASYMFSGDQYTVAISPYDNTIQFEKTFPILTRFSLGLVWNPLPNLSEANKEIYRKNKLILAGYEAARRHFAAALLVNVFQLGFSSDQINTNSPIDVGFGIGFRNENFLVLGTLEFTPIRTPRQYFLDKFKDKNLPLILAGSQEPVKSISVDDNTIFVNRIFPSIGIKIAYSFSKAKQAK